MRVLAARGHGYRGAVLALLLRAAGHQAGGLDWARLRLMVTLAGSARGG
jgi:hypothetical protein